LDQYGCDSGLIKQVRYGDHSPIIEQATTTTVVHRGESTAAVANANVTIVTE
jgi:hypothetical protein